MTTLTLPLRRGAHACLAFAALVSINACVLDDGSVSVSSDSSGTATATSSGQATSGASPSSRGSSPTPSAVPAGAGIPAPGSMSALSASGPIRLESNRTYSGLRITSSGGPCVKAEGVTNVRITASEIGPCGSGSNAEEVGVLISNSSNVRVDGNVIHGVASGVYAQASRDNIVVDRNYIYGVRGPFPRGNIVQFAEVNGRGNKIMCNVGNNTVDDRMEDNISTWQSRGTADSPIEIAYNRVTGGSSQSGTGIIVGDGSGSEYIFVHRNTIVNVNNAGIAVAGGRHIVVSDNRVYNNYARSSNGISVQAYAACDDVKIERNRTWAFDNVWGTNKVWHFNNNDYGNAASCSNLQLSGNAFGDGSLNANILNEPYPECG
jgi:parallel beta-helix repeat protein